MSLFEILLMLAIAGGAVLLLYHSLWNKKGCCGDDGCSGCDEKRP